MIINSDHSIITTPIESPETETTGRKKGTQNESDETLTSDDDLLHGTKKRQKARNESVRREKYEFFCCVCLSMFKKSNR